MAEPGRLLESFLPRDRCAALATGTTVPQRSPGSALFADISGFTSLSETMADTYGARRGAEELTRILNAVYEQLIEAVTAWGGVVMYLSGDAITCWFDGDDGAAAVQAALDQQVIMGVLARELPLPGGGTLALKVAVAVGEARRFVVGDPAAGRIDVLAGPLVDRLAVAEGTAERGEVVADDTAVASLGDRLVVAQWRVDDTTGRRLGLVERLAVAPAPVAAVPDRALPVEVVREWIAPDVFDRLVSGGDLFLAELRSAYPIFVRFGGFDFEHGDVEGVLDQFIREVQATLARFGGFLLGITVGDKGAYLNAVVGTPRSHEDDALRAVAASVAIRDLEGRTAASSIQVGVSVGQVYSGTYGSPTRRAMSVLGDPVNLAARLMTAAPSGEVYVFGEVADAVDEHFEWLDLPPLVLKGKTEPVRARAVVRERARRPQRVRRYLLPMVGRDRELDLVRSAIGDAVAGERRVITVAADAGLGKSRFVAEVLRHAQAVGLPVAFGQGESMARSTSYFPWRTSWRALLGVDDEWSEIEAVAHLERELAAIDPALVPRLPLLGAVIGIDIASNDLVRSLDAKLRKSSLENLLGDVLVHRLAGGPQLIVVDDLHWADPLSIELLLTLVRRTAGRGVAFLLAHRPEGDAMLPEPIATLAGRVAIELSELDAAGMRAVVEASCRQVFGPDVRIAAGLVSLVLDRAQGNPFYAEELIRYVERFGVDPGDPGAASQLHLPDSLNAIVLSRVDGLDELPRQVVKVASVIGREFRAELVADVHDSIGDERAVVGHLAAARSVDLVTPERDDLEGWLFRHAIIREVAYESLPFGLRAPLHERVGDAIARRDGLGPRLTEIADHYWSSANLDKQREFLRLAGDAAREAYANAAAIQHYERLATVVDGVDRARALLDLSGVLELVGAWDRADAVAHDARALAEERGDAALVGWCDVSVAEIARKHGHYDDAVALLERAHATLTRHGDDAGAARALHLQGTVAAQQGKLDDAIGLYGRSREIRERTGDAAGLAALLSNLGVVSNYQGDYEAARDYHRRSLELRTELGDLGAISVSYTNLGILAVGQQRYDEAHELFDESMRLSAAVGDAWMLAIAHNNLGNALRGLGRLDDARHHYAEALAAYREYDDRWAIAFLLEDLAALAASAAQPEQALGLLGAADRVRHVIDARRPDSQTDELDGWIAPSLVDLTDEQIAAARAAGRELTDVEALDRAASFCRATAGRGGTGPDGV